LIAAAAGAFLLAFNWPKFDPTATPTDAAEVPIIEDSLISTHNESDTHYLLGGNKLFDGVSVQEGKKLFHNSIAMQTKGMPKCGPSKDTSELPSKFNWREKHPECEKSVMDQGNTPKPFQKIHKTWLISPKLTRERFSCYLEIFFIPKINFY
jgi:hypothetical protein